MSQPNTILLVTAPEYAEIQKFVSMNIGLDALSRAIGEIVSVPPEELCLPIYFQVDARAPGLRFVDYPEVVAPSVPPPQPPPSPEAGGPVPAPDLGPYDLTGMVNHARRVFLIAEL